MPRRKKLPPYVRRHGDGFRTVFVIDGVRRRSPTFNTPDEAIQWRADFLAVEQLPAGQSVECTFATARELILQHLRETDARDGTREWYLNHARTLLAHFGSATPLHRIGRADVAAFVTQRLAAGVSAGTVVKREVQILRRMFKLAREAGYPLPVDPFTKLKLPQVRTGRFEFLTQRRVAELVAAMRKHKAPLAGWHADIVELLFGTGLRRAELFRLRVADIDFDAGRIFVDGKVRPRYQTFGRSLEPVLRRLVAEAKGGVIVPHPTGLEQAFTVWQKRLGEPRLTCHTLRHSYGTAMADHVTPFDLMGLMGHSTLSQTSRYFHARGDAVRGALDLLRLDPQDPAPPPTDSGQPPPAST